MKILLVDQQIGSSRRVAAAAVLENPLAGSRPDADLSPLVELSVEVGRTLTGRVLQALAPLEPRGYGKAALVGTAGELEHGAAMIHVRLGLAMREGAGLDQVAETVRKIRGG